MPITKIQTETGSCYIVREEDGQFFLSGDNKLNPNSAPIQDGEWEIAQPNPWPPEKGRQLLFYSVHFQHFSHRERMPGGGKLTSRVVDSYIYEPEAAR
jgi:hypothetical protein